MSGGSSAGGRPSGPTQGDCNIVEKTPLNSPQAAVIKTLKVGDVLDVDLSKAGKVVVARKAGAIAGSLTPFRLVELIDCMQHGRKYVAVVTQLKGGYCEVEIRPK